MHDDVEPLVPVRLVIDRVLMMRIADRVIRDRPDDIGSGRNALRKNVLLMFVIVAASTTNEQGSNRFWLLRLYRQWPDKSANQDENESDQSAAHGASSVRHGIADLLD